MKRELLVLGCAALALAGCNKEDKKVVAGSAQGEVLPGSASDAMLPLDSVKSHPPLGPKGDGASANAGKDNGKDR